MKKYALWLENKVVLYKDNSTESDFIICSAKY